MENSSIQILSQALLLPHRDLRWLHSMIATHLEQLDMRSQDKDALSVERLKTMMARSRDLKGWELVLCAGYIVVGGKDHRFFMSRDISLLLSEIGQVVANVTATITVLSQRGFVTATAVSEARSHQKFQLTQSGHHEIVAIWDRKSHFQEIGKVEPFRVVS